MATTKSNRKQKRKQIRAGSGGRTERPRAPAEDRFLQRVGKRVKLLRAEAGITALEMAAAIQVTQSVQFRREHGDINFPVCDLVRYAKMLRCRPAELLE
jgi:ribosome-binding protein aMBF1 (putative translation factor)